MPGKWCRTVSAGSRKRKNYAHYGKNKTGVGLFPHEHQFHARPRGASCHEAEGDAAFATLVETLSYIYAGKGYYIPASDEFYDELTDSLYNTDMDDVKRIIALSVECGLFDAGLFSANTAS